MKRKLAMVTIMASMALFTGCRTEGVETPSSIATEQNEIAQTTDAIEETQMMESTKTTEEVSTPAVLDNTTETQTNNPENIVAETETNSQENAATEIQTNSQENAVTETETNSQENAATETEINSQEAQADFQQETKEIEGYQLIDGRSVPVKVSFTLEGIQKGEDAYHLLVEANPEIAAPKEDEEYIIATFKISYDEGDADEIYLAENRGTMQGASLYFALSNGDSNAEEVTGFLADNVYNLSIAKGESAEGSVAFLHKKDSIEPLYFLGFDNSISFHIN